MSGCRVDHDEEFCTCPHYIDRIIGEGDEVDECNDCGALVVDTPQHSRWHKLIREAIRHVN